MNRIHHRRERPQCLFVTIEHMDDQRLLLQRPCGGLPDLAGANHQYGRRRALPRDQRIERANLRGRPGHDRYGIGVNSRVWKGRLQSTALPQPDNAQAGQLAQASIPHQRARQDRVSGRQLGDMHAVEGANHVRLGASGIHPVRKRLAELALQRQYGGGATELKDVDRVLLLDNGRDVHVRSDLANGQRDVRVGRILAVGDNQPRGRSLQALVGGPAVVLAGDHGKIFADKPRRLRGVRFDNEVGDPGRIQPLDQAGRHRVGTR